MEEVRIGSFENFEMPPEPPQKRAEELEDHVDNRAKKRISRKGSSQMSQPVRKKKDEEGADIEKASPEKAKAEAIKPNIDRPKVTREGKIARKTPKGIARPL